MTRKEILNQIIKANRGRHLDRLKELMKEEQGERFSTYDFDNAKDLNRKQRGDL